MVLHAERSMQEGHGNNNNHAQVINRRLCLVRVCLRKKRPTFEKPWERRWDAIVERCSAGKAGTRTRRLRQVGRWRAVKRVALPVPPGALGVTSPNGKAEGKTHEPSRERRKERDHREEDLRATLAQP
ncbi:hypothetical protein VTN02DRAFT_2277 [Thermoascus thermophilus]